MHQNPRRKNRYRNPDSRHGFSMAWYRANCARKRRRAVRRYIFREQYDYIPLRYFHDLLYNLL